jgi:hypothetical protein
LALTSPSYPNEVPKLKRLHTIFTLVTIETWNTLAGVRIHSVNTRSTILTWLGGTIIYVCYKKGGLLITIKAENLASKLFPNGSFQKTLIPLPQGKLEVNPPTPLGCPKYT